MTEARHRFVIRRIVAQLQPANLTLRNAIGALRAAIENVETNCAQLKSDKAASAEQRQSIAKQ